MERVREPHFVMLGDVEWERVRVLQMEAEGDKLDVPITLGLRVDAKDGAAFILAPAASPVGENADDTEAQGVGVPERLALIHTDIVLLIENVRVPHFVMLGDADCERVRVLHTEAESVLVTDTLLLKEA